MYRLNKKDKSILSSLKHKTKRCVFEAVKLKLGVYRSDSKTSVIRKSQFIFLTLKNYPCLFKMTDTDYH